MGPWDFGVSRIIVMVIYGYEYHIYIYMCIYIYINNSSNEHEMWFQNFSAWCLAWCHHWKHKKPTLEALMTISNADTKPIDITVPALRVQCCSFITSSKFSSVTIRAKPLSQPFRAAFWRIPHFYEILPLIIWSSLVVIQLMIPMMSLGLSKHWDVTTRHAFTVSPSLGFASRRRSKFGVKHGQVPIFTSTFLHQHISNK